MDITLANHSLETAVFSSKDGNGSPHVEHAESDCQFSMMMGIELSNDICSYRMIQPGVCKKKLPGDHSGTVRSTIVRMSQSLKVDKRELLPSIISSSQTPNW